MIESKRTSDKQYPNTDRITTGQPYASSVVTSTGGRADRIEDSIQSMTDQPTTGSASNNMRTEVAKTVNSPTMTPQPETSPANRGINPVLNRALIGGLFTVFATSVRMLLLAEPVVG